jgi:hypothetical protein
MLDRDRAPEFSTLLIADVQRAVVVEEIPLAFAFRYRCGS